MAVLDKMYLQPGTADAQLGENGRTFTEVWKGPWAAIKDVASTGKVFNTTLLPGGKRPQFNNGSWDFSAGTPAPMSSSLPWIISGIEIQQTIGDHGTLTITYQSGGGDGADSETDPDAGQFPDDDDEDPAKKIESATSWQLSWESFKRSVLEYSENPKAISMYKNYPTGVDYQYFMSGDRNGRKAYITDAGNGKERMIADYFRKGVSPQFHYPVVTLHEEYTIPSDKEFQFTIGQNLDYAPVQLPNNCPFKRGLSGRGKNNPDQTTGPEAKTNWKWMLVSDVGTISSEKKGVEVLRQVPGQQAQDRKIMKKYVRERKWQGAVYWDAHFYGANAWKPKYNDNNQANT